MKAIQISGYGGNEVIQVVDNADVPQIIEGHILVKVRRASINPIDTVIRSGYLQQYLPLQFPATLGSAFSGVVQEVWSDTTGFKTGDKVFGSGTQFSGGSGAFAEFVLVPTGSLGHQPSFINDEIAATIPSSALTAHIALFENADLLPGDKVLIHGGAGGIGSVAIQLAKSAKTYVATTVSKNDLAYAKELGADQVIDYKNEAFESTLKEYDWILDTVGGEVYKKSFQVLKKNGSMLSVVEQPNTELMSTFKVDATFVKGMVTPERLINFCKMFERIKPTIRVGDTFSMKQGIEAFEVYEKRLSRGKIIIKVA